MEARVRLTGMVRHLVNESECRASLADDATIEDLVGALVERYGAKFGEQLFRTNGELNGSVRIFVDNKSVTSLKQRLGAGNGATAEVSIVVLSPVSGG